MNHVMNKSKKSILALMVLILVAVLAPITISMGSSYASAYTIRVNKATNVVTIYNSGGAAVKAMTCSTGEATPIGTFRVSDKYRWHELMGPCWGQYSSRFRPGMLFHSVYYWTNYNPSTQDWDAWNKLGTTASHGCIRLTTADAKWIYDNCASGTTVSIFFGSANDDPLGKPAVLKVSQGAWNGWDPTDPNASNPWHSASPSINVKSTKVQYGSNFNASSRIAAYDSARNDVTSWVSISGANKVNTKKLGRKYKVTYTVTDALGRTASKVVTYKIVDEKKPIIKGFRSAVKTKEYNATFKFKSGVTAKSYTGKNLLSKLRIYVKAPGASKYKKLKGSTIKLSKLGTYTFKYKLNNPKNKKVATKYRKIVVKDTKKPLIYGMTSNKTVTYNSTMNFKSGLSAKLRSGKKLTSSLIVSINPPKGKRIVYRKYSQIKKSFRFTQLGRYKITYTAQNPTSKKKLVRTRYITVVDPVTITANNVTSGLDLNNTTSITNYNLLSLATASGAKSGNLTSSIKVNSVKNPLNQDVTITNGKMITFDMEGKYTVVYQVSGKYLRTATKTITLLVVNSTPTKTSIGSTVLEDSATEDSNAPDTSSGDTISDDTNSDDINLDDINLDDTNLDDTDSNDTDSNDTDLDNTDLDDTNSDNTDSDNTESDGVNSGNTDSNTDTSQTNNK